MPVAIFFEIYNKINVNETSRNKKTPVKGFCGVGRTTTIQYCKGFQLMGGNIGGKNRQVAIILPFWIVAKFCHFVIFLIIPIFVQIFSFHSLFLASENYFFCVGVLSG